MNVLVADIGGTRARFAIAERRGGGVELRETAVLAVADHLDFSSALRAYADSSGEPLPPRASLALATDITGDVVEMVNSDWVIDRSAIAAEFGFEDCRLFNDFEAIAHTVAAANECDFVHLFGPRREIAGSGCTTIVGPGTGLGVAQLIRTGRHCHVVPTEGGHIGFAPRDAFERRLRDALSERYPRVSVERVAAGPGLIEFYAALDGVASDGVAMSDAELWAAALNGTDPSAAEALDRFVASLGAIVGDLVLAQGSDSVVLVGALSDRLQERLRSSLFADGLRDKGRFSGRMSQVRGSLLRCDQPGLRGAALACLERL